MEGSRLVFKATRHTKAHQGCFPRLSSLGAAVLVIVCSAAGSGCGGGGGGSGSEPAEEGIPSVCGGVVTSSPKVCNPSVVQDASGALHLRFGLSDLEGDIDQYCYGLGPLGSTPDCTHWFFIASFGKTINAFVTSGTEMQFPADGVASGATAAITMSVTDHTGHSVTIHAEMQIP